MPKAPGAKKILARVRKDLKVKKVNGKRVSRRNATVVLAQGALAVPRKNFGTAMQGKKSVSALVKCLDARIPRTLGLPRAVGPYTVIRTTKLHQSSANFVLFSPFYGRGGSGAVANSWYNWCGIEDVNSANPVVGGDNTSPIFMPVDGLGEACEVVPAALTVQVMNPNSLQTANGVFAMTRVNQQMAMGGSPTSVTYDELAARVLSFYSPRLLTGGKLALRGVKCSSYPLDMTEYAEFAPFRHDVTGPFTWTPQVRPAALAPIIFVQNNAEPQTLEFMITIEWRVRFDPGNPATASHTHHDTLSDECWNSVVKAASSVGHGVEELAEDVADGGMLLGAAAAMA